jgi:hypothetical protein
MVPLQRKLYHLQGIHNDNVVNIIEYKKKFHQDKRAYYDEQKRHIKSQQISELQAELESLDNECTYLRTFFCTENDRKIKAELLLQRQVFKIIKQEITDARKKIETRLRPSY